MHVLPPLFLVFMFCVIIIFVLFWFLRGYELCKKKHQLRTRMALHMLIHLRFIHVAAKYSWRLNSDVSWKFRDDLPARTISSSTRVLLARLVCVRSSDPEKITNYCTTTKLRTVCEKSDPSVWLRRTNSISIPFQSIPAMDVNHRALFFPIQKMYSLLLELIL